MRIKANNPLSYLGNDEINPILEIYFAFNHLKQLYRQGWLKRGVPDDLCESVADHTLGVAVLAMLLAKRVSPQLDTLKVLMLSLLHDFGEIHEGDLTPDDAISKEMKTENERVALRQTFQNLPEAEGYQALWEEYNQGISPEALFVQQIDKLEMALQAKIYQLHCDLKPDEFFQSASEALFDKEFVDILSELKKITRHNQ